MRQAGDRIAYIDYAKSIAIYLVLLSHTTLSSSASCWINSFHVPLFFFLSGFLFSYESNPRLVPFIHKKTRQLLLSYVLLNVLTWMFWLAEQQLRGGGSASSDMPLWWEPLVSSLYVDVAGMVHNIPLWFFPSLFIVAIIGHLVLRRVRSIVVLAASLLCGYAIYRYVGYTPLVLGQSAVAMFFYVLGYVFRHQCRLPYWTIAVLLPLSVCSVFFNDRVGMYINYYGCFPLFIVFAMAGVFLMLVLSRILHHVFGACRLVILVSDNTLPICGLHLVVFALLKGLLHYVLRIDIQQLFDGVLLPNIIFSLVSLVLCIPLSLLMGRYMPWAIGLRRRR